MTYNIMTFCMTFYDIIYNDIFMTYYTRIFVMTYYTVTFFITYNAWFEADNIFFLNLFMLFSNRWSSVKNEWLSGAAV